MAIYYVKNGGNDANTGLSDGQAWATIAKVNASSFNPGDQILFKKGSTWNETLTVTSSGVGGNPIIFGAYDTGAAPIISGFTTLTGWANYGGGIYSKTFSANCNPNLLLYDGVSVPLGRNPIGISSPYVWPSNAPHNSTWTNTSLTEGAHPDGNGTVASFSNMVGAEIVIRSSYFTADRRHVNTHTGDTLTFDYVGYLPVTGFGYFFQNHINCLSAVGEWCYSGSTLYMYFGAEDPTNHTVKIPTNAFLIEVAASYITINGIDCEGVGDSGITLNSGTTHNTVTNCTVTYAGNTGILSAGSTYATIEYNTVTWCQNEGIHLYSGYDASSSSNPTIQHNIVSHIGDILGMGNPTYLYDGRTDLAKTNLSNTNESGAGIYSQNAYSTISYNTISYTGYMGISFEGLNSVVSYNRVSHTNINRPDGGGIYTWRFNTHPRTIDHNIITDIIEPLYGMWGWDTQNSVWVPTDQEVYGIYLDGAGQITVTNNTLANIEFVGIYLNCNQNSVIENNTIYNTHKNIHIMGEPDWSGIPNRQDGRPRGHKIRYNTSVTNITNGSDHFVFDICTQIDDLSELSNFTLPTTASGIPSITGEIDHNYHVSPYKSDNYMYRQYYAWTWYPPYLIDINLSEMQGYGPDGSEYETASTIYTGSNYYSSQIVYNETSSSKNYSLSESMIDARNNTYLGTITLFPFTSIILFGAGIVTEEVLVPVDVTSITVTGTGGLITIITDNGTLQMIATVLPVDATNMNVTWSIMPGTGTGTISATGLLTAISDGTVTVRATAQDGTGIYDELELTFSNQVTQSVIADMLAYFPLNEFSGTTVTDLIASLEGTSTATPTAYGQDFANVGSIYISPTTINPTGDKFTVSLYFKLDVLPIGLGHDIVLFRYGYSGAPWITMNLKLRAVDNKPEFEIKNQAETGYFVYGSTAVVEGVWYMLTAICRGNGTPLELYLNTTEIGSGDTDTFLGASILSSTGMVVIGNNYEGGTEPMDGLIKYVGLWDRDLSISEISLINTSDYPYDTGTIYVTSVTVTGTGGLSAITTNAGTLQMIATVLPVDATDSTVTWSVINGTGTATISATGLLTAITNGTVTVKAVSNDSL